MYNLKKNDKVLIILAGPRGEGFIFPAMVRRCNSLLQIIDSVSNEIKPELKDVRANCSCASLLRT